MTFLKRLHLFQKAHKVLMIHQNDNKEDEVFVLEVI